MDKVLLVDDEVDLLTTTDLILSIHGFTVKSVADYTQIDEAIKTFEPDIILLDVNLSGIDGRKVCRSLKANDTTKHIPVLLFSAIANLEEGVASCNADGFISKPFDLHMMVDTVKKLIYKG